MRTNPIDKENKKKAQPGNSTQIPGERVDNPTRQIKETQTKHNTNLLKMSP
jgi:hypothetical protein